MELALNHDLPQWICDITAGDAGEQFGRQIRKAVLQFHTTPIAPSTGQGIAGSIHAGSLDTALPSGERGYCDCHRRAWMSHYRPRETGHQTRRSATP